MNKYIFYTTEGHTDAPNENVEVENCQVLGFAKGRNAQEAQTILLKENPWIIEAGFDPIEFIVKQVLTEEQMQYINTIVDYLWDEEKRHYEESFNIDLDKENLGVDADLNNTHIFSILKRLKEMYE